MIEELTDNALVDGVYDVSTLDSKGVKVKGDTPTDGWVELSGTDVVKFSLKLGDYVVDYDGTTTTVTKNGSIATKPAGNAKKYTIVNDADSNGIADIGDEIQVNGENFYVISNTNGKISALAKYNLNVGSNAKGTATGIQDSEVLGWLSSSSGLTKYGNVAFSDNNGWAYANDDDIDIQSYDGPVKSALNNYKTVVTNAREVRLITKTELEGLGCDSSSYTCSGAPAWVYSTSYWAGSARSNVGVWIVNSNGFFSGHDFRYDVNFGVRPVIILES